MFHLGSKYSVLLFQHIASLVNLDRINARTFTVPELRALLGVPEGKLERFSNLTQKALKPAIDEINQLSRMTLTATPNKIGRTVARITIGWQVKDDPGAAKRELAGSKLGREVRRSGAAETPVLAFPETGGITYSPRWIELKRAAGCNKVNELIASDFRRFCRDRSIRLDAVNIEKVFSDFCVKVGQV
ncbi:replication initiation protein [Paracoccus sp. IB05]|uniref:replication initiation protein n=1 Tax=Paracoccus sp. IB05 TaxID=2779367 RepID=UPI0018E73133|nr:RepB family plasmid replication initiator protein [Paracoccus sp. IB05]